MSSGEEFEVDEILEQRKRKGVVEYLIRWKGFNDLYDSWEPATSLTDCAQAVKAFAAKLTKQRSRSKSRSRSRGRSSKSRSRSTSRGRKTKSDITPKRSRSRSSGRTTKSTVKTSSEIIVTKTESSAAAELQTGKLRSGAVKAVEQETSDSKREKETEVEKKAVAAKEEKVVEQKTRVIKTTMETVQSSASSMKSESSSGDGMVTRSRMAVRQVQNDQQRAVGAKGSGARKGGKDDRTNWLWWFADHAVLLLFIVVSLIALSFTIDSLSEVRDKLTPDLGVLRQRLGESYAHITQGVTALFTFLKEGVFGGGAAPTPAAPQQPPATPPQQTGA